MGHTAKSVSPAGNEARNAYVVERLTEALLEMLEERPLEDIRVNELCARAQVGRASFYRNFSSKEDVLRVRVRRVLAAWAASREGCDGEPVSGVVQSLFSCLERERALFGLLSKRNLTYLIKDVLLELMGFDPQGPGELVYAQAYATYVLFGWVEVWLARGMRDPAEWLADALRARGL